MTHEEVIQKVRRLYALAQNTTEGEAQAAMAAAERLIQAHRLSEAEIEGPGSVAAAVKRGEFGKAPRDRWRRFLMNFLADRYSCALIQTAGFNGEPMVKAYGTEADLALLRLQYDRIGDLIHYHSIRASNGKGRDYLTAYRLGMLEAIAKRLELDRPKGVETTAIVRLDARKEEAKQELGKDFPHTIVRHSRPQRVRLDGYRHGEHDGANLHLGESMGSGVRGEIGDGS